MKSKKDKSEIPYAVALPADFRKAIYGNKKAKVVWEDITPMMRRDWIWWVISGKKKETRPKRVKVAISKLSGGMRRPCCFGGINWLIKSGQCDISKIGK